MKLHILSHEESRCYQIPENETAIMIRILDPKEPFYQVENKERYKQIYSFNFNDMTKKTYDYIAKEESDELKNYTLFDKGHAKEILRIYNLNEGVHHLIIHCAAGISRSAGVALGLAFYNKELEWKKQIVDNHIPNLHIANTIISLFSKELILEDKSKEFVRNSKVLSW